MSEPSQPARNPKEQGTLSCPQCGFEFEISDALAARIRDGLRSELQAEIARREAEVQKKADQIRAAKDEIERRSQHMDEEVAGKLKQRLAEAESRAAKKIEERFIDQMKEMQQTLKEREEAISSFRQNELELRKKQRELEKAKEEMELEVQRKLDAETAKIRQETETSLAEKHRLKQMESEKIISDLRAALEEARRKAEQGSQQTQGEALELDFESRLAQFFRDDQILPVPKGIRGADLMQLVRTPQGRECGLLLWETKNTRAWNAGWIPKLKADMIEVRAAIGILVTVALPEGVSRFAPKDGVWVAESLSAIPLAAALREQLLAIDHERRASEGKNEKMETLYQYLAGTEFKQKIEGIVEAFTALQEQLNRERRAMEKQWKEREKQIERVVKNTVRLYGDMQGIIGGSIAQIPALELEGDGFKLIQSSGEDEDAD